MKQLRERKKKSGTLETKSYPQSSLNSFLLNSRHHLEFKELRPTHAGRITLPSGSLDARSLISESPADLNNVEATQGEVKLEVAGR